MDLELTGGVAVVTGASQGIGKAIAETLAGEGMRVVLVARREAELQRVASGLPTGSLVQAVDLRDPAAPEVVVAATLQAFSRIDLVVNNAGTTKRGDFFELTDA